MSGQAYLKLQIRCIPFDAALSCWAKGTGETDKAFLLKKKMYNVHSYITRFLINHQVYSALKGFNDYTRKAWNRMDTSAKTVHD